jgi:GNAT superfamily N-acetyltransferase
MTPESLAPLPGLHLTSDRDPTIETRRKLWAEINAFNAQTVRLEVSRLALLLHTDAGVLASGVSVAMYWGWMFVDALWVAEAWRGRGVGSWLMARVEQEARLTGCHSSWLDTFRARSFYEAIGYVVFAELEDYPAGQSRWFMRKPLLAPACGSAQSAEGSQFLSARKR